MYSNIFIVDVNYICLGVQFFESSAKENINVKPVFDCLVDSICDNMAEALDAEVAAMSRSRTADLKSVTEAAPAGCKC